MQRKVFWILFITSSVLAELALPLIWGVIATIPLVLVCWWVAFRSGWFE